MKGCAGLWTIRAGFDRPQPGDANTQKVLKVLAAVFPSRVPVYPRIPDHDDDEITAAASPPTSAIPKIAIPVHPPKSPMRVPSVEGTFAFARLTRIERASDAQNPRGRRRGARPRAGTARAMGRVRKAPGTAFQPVPKHRRFVEPRGPFCYLQLWLPEEPSHPVGMNLLSQRRRATRQVSLDSSRFVATPWRGDRSSSAPPKRHGYRDPRLPTPRPMRPSAR